jgi:hypothetical protein
MAKISDFLHLELEEQKCPNYSKYLKFFWLKIFLICLRCQKHQCWTHALPISPWIFEKNRNVYWYYQGIGGRWFMKKFWSEKSCGTVALSTGKTFKISKFCPLKSRLLSKFRQYYEGRYWHKSKILSIYPLAKLKIPFPIIKWTQGKYAVLLYWKREQFSY